MDSRSKPVSRTFWTVVDTFAPICWRAIELAVTALMVAVMLLVLAFIGGLVLLAWLARNTPPEYLTP